MSRSLERFTISLETEVQIRDPCLLGHLSTSHKILIFRPKHLASLSCLSSISHLSLSAAPSRESLETLTPARTFHQFPRSQAWLTSSAFSRMSTKRRRNLTPTSTSSGIASNNGNLSRACLVLTLGNGEKIHLSVEVPPKFPLQPPEMKCDSEVVHPNVRGDCVCASILVSFPH